MNNMSEKPIQDERKAKHTKYCLKGVCIGLALLILGLILFFIKAFSPNYLDATGRLHEDNFILLPISFLFLLSSVIIFAIVGIRNIVALLKGKDDSARKAHIVISVVSLAIVIVFVALFALLIASNS